ncbi:MAG: type II toxin-antitoxin system RelB/DinJ family antitoxin [Oscillospiraceae bacterium]|nr:type II toxin-antitoxin system RelB/DinJ family antitoxin [Oscillospiraceae bacterium]
MMQITIPIDDDVKKNADALFDELGLSLTSAINAFLKQSIREGGLPFHLTTKVDLFYSDENMEYLRQSIKDAEDGKLTPHELIED